jgi:methionine-S-sulfoxide reductase/methionine-R-sulfoxide reductase|uniref:peptide-methionine (S)-S-oxide reductase n=1 Tax=Mimiviridae sp. ChoanoV1 TaxID=2596887 RepID=A0A5B8IFB4_9VIRU|nr:peptide methionine sulfoxide reductase [Mimiviridae sp. ChoanoV1]
MKTKKNNLKINYFSGGCFWGIQNKFDSLKGIIKTEVGYMGGNLNNPTYIDVCQGKSGHFETIKVQYNSNIISYKNLILKFLDFHDPTSMNKQGLNIGEQYRSVIYYNNKNDKIIIKNILKEVESKKNEKIVTQIMKKTKFFKAEKYHQKYYNKKEHPKTENLNLFKKICTNNSKLAEPKGSGKYYMYNYRVGINKGIYKCANCSNILYSSKDAYDAKTGWPAFSNTIDKKTKKNNSKYIKYNKKTGELKCRKCNIHLGHRFFDGPTETKTRDCINSVCLFFESELQDL